MYIYIYEHVYLVSPDSFLDLASQDLALRAFPYLCGHLCVCIFIYIFFFNKICEVILLKTARS